MGKLAIPTLGKKGNTEHPKVNAAIEALNAILGEENKVKGSGIEAGAKPVTWYTPKVIAAEESRTNIAFGTLATADEVKSVVLPENGLIEIGYVAKWKSSVGSAGRAAIFVEATQLKKATTAGNQEALTNGAGWNTLSTASFGLNGNPGAGEAAFVTTGQPMSADAEGSAGGGGSCLVFAAAGTYNISVQFKATSGSVTAKERKLWVCVRGY